MTEKIIGGRKICLMGDPAAKDLLIQPVDDHDLSVLEQQYETIRSQIKDREVCLAAFSIHDWNIELSPWPAPPVFGREPFGDGAGETLRFLTDEMIPALCPKDDQGDAASRRRLFLGGYSLAGLFALWAAYQTDIFAGVAGVSPSVWFPGWQEYIQTHRCLSPLVYLSLGTKEEKTRNQVMARVGDGIRSQYELLRDQGYTCVLEWNPGNHFQDSGGRCAKGYTWLLSQSR